MAPPAVEIATFSASDAYKQDQKVLLPALELLKTVDGVIDIWHGPQIQDPSQFHLVVFWQTVEQHQRYIDDKPAYGKLFAAITPAITQFHGLLHYIFPADITPALDAPVTELVSWKIHEGVDRAAFLDTVRELEQTIYKDMPDEVFHGGVAPAVEDERGAAVVLGWHSVERFNNAVYNNKKCVELVTGLKQQGELDLKHARLTRFTKN